MDGPDYRRFSNPERDVVDWVDLEDRLARHAIRYADAGTTWTDGLPLGNGDLAALAYAPFFPEWLVNKLDVWDYREPEPARSRRTIQEVRDLLAAGGSIRDLADEDPPDRRDYPQPKSCGGVRLEMGRARVFSPPYRIGQSLDLATGTLAETLDRHLSHPRISSFVAAERNLLVIRVRDVSACANPANTVVLERDRDCLLGEPQPGAADDRAWLDMSMPAGDRYVLMGRAVPTGGMAHRDLMTRHFREGVRLPEPGITGARTEGHQAQVQVTGDFDLFVTVVTSREAADPLAAAVALLESGVQAGADALHRDHCAWWRRFWEQAAWFDSSNAFLDGWWYASLYASASTLRRAPAPGLCGLWYGPSGDAAQRLPWLGYYTHDYNMQMSATPMPTVGHPELIEPYIETLYAALPLCRREARERYGVEGAVYPLGSGPRCHDVASGLYRHCEQASGPFWGAIFAVWHAVLHDDDLLRERFYPIVREVATFFANYMILDEAAGRYRLWPTQPVEYYYLDKANPTATLTLLRRTLRFAVASARHLGVDDDRRERWEDLLEHFPEYPEDRGVWTVAEGLPREHYVWSTVAWMLWPAGEVAADSPTAPEDAARRTLDYYRPRASRSRAQDHGAHEGSFGSTVMHALSELRLGNRAEAWRLFLEDGMRLYPKPNGLIAHNPTLWCPAERSEANLDTIPDIALRDGDEWMPLWEPASGLGTLECTEYRRHREWSCPVSEGNSGFLLFLGEMMVQSWRGLIEVFPGWGDGAAQFDAAFDGIWVEGGFVVSARCAGGRTRSVRICSRAGGVLRLANPWSGEAVDCRRNGEPVTGLAGEVLECIAEAGDVWRFEPADSDVDAAVDAAHEAAPRALCFADGNTTWYGKPDPVTYLQSPPELPRIAVRQPPTTGLEDA